MESPLTFLVIGAGAIGSYIGGSLALSGQRVVFLDRPEAVEKIRARGMVFRLPDGEHILTPQLAASVPEALAYGPFDAGVFAVKSYHTEAALQPLISHAASLPPLVCLQNGVDNEPLLEAALGREKIIAGTVTTAIGIPAPGTVAVERLRGVGLAVPPGSSLGLLATRIKTAMDQAGLRAALYPRPVDMKWSKLMTNLTANATAAILDMTPAEVFAHPGLARLEIQQQRETLAVMRAIGARVIALPGTPVPLFAWAVQFLPLRLAQPFLRRAIGRGRGGKMPSLHIDLHAGNPLSEVLALNGAVAAHGHHRGVLTPVNQMLNDTVLALARGDLPLNSYARKPEKLLNRG